MANLKILNGLAVIFLAVNVIEAKSVDNKVARATDQDYLLPVHFTPSLYDLTLILAEDAFTTNKFSGILDLTFSTSAAVNEIVLHANGINITSATLVDNQNQGVDITGSNFVSDLETDKLVISLKEGSLRINEDYKLHFEYTGSLRTDSMYGFYRSSYEENGVDKYLATTQFQPTHARKAFPCFDEPQYKAQFNIKIEHSKNLTALSNTPGESVDLNNDRVLTTFKPTPKMSTYLIAFIISEFTCTKGSNLYGDIPYQVCSRNESAETRTYAVDIGPKLIQALEYFTGITYNYSGIGKMDQVAIPDFSAGAMENWGLVTYRERGLLYDPVESSNSFLQSIALVNAHEFTHMWFGNLITTHWWSDTFLNEGWARYLQYIITNEVEKTWELDKQIVVASVQGIMQTDALESAWALSSAAFSQQQISAKFGSISYDKGSSVLRMVDHIMGRDNFKAGINNYLTTHEFSHTEPKDLWDALQGSITADSKLPAGVSLNDIMQNWVDRAGFPILTIELDNNDISISQERFLISGSPNSDEKWYVPISYTKSSDKSKFTQTYPNAWLLPNQNLTLQNVLTPSNDSWIIINNQQAGYYRVNYAEQLWDRIATALKRDNFDGIHVLNRAQIVDDLFNLAKIGKLSYERVFNLIEFLSNDLSYYSWYSTFQAVAHMWQRSSSIQIRDNLAKHFLTLMGNFLSTVSFDNSDDDNHMYTLKRVLALTWACRFNQADCVEKSLASFENYRKSDTKPNKNLRSIVYCTALSSSDKIQEDWDFLWNKYLSESLQTEKVTILTALGCTSDRTRLNEYLSKSINASSGIKPQDALSVFSAVYSGSLEGVDVALDFMTEYHQDIVSSYGSMNSLDSMITGLAGRFTKEEQITKLEEFAGKVDLDPQLVDSANKAIESARANLQWTTDFEKQLSDYYDIPNGSGIISISVQLFIGALAFLIYFK